MAYTLDDLRKIKNGRGTDSASSSDYTNNQGNHTLEELRSIGNRSQETVNNQYDYLSETETPSNRTNKRQSFIDKLPDGKNTPYVTHTGNNTLDSLNTMMSYLNVFRDVSTTPKNMPTLQTNEEIKDYYESLGSYNAIERLLNPDKKEKYNQKQALKPKYDEITKQEDLDVLRQYGITDEDLYTAAYQKDYNGQSILSIDTDKNIDLSYEGRKAIDDKFKKAYEDTGINPYWYLDDYKKAIVEKEADTAPVLTTLNTYAKNPGESLGNVALDAVAYLGGEPIENNYSYTDTVRNRITKGIDSDLGRFAYGTANSIADMGVSMAIGAGTGLGTFASAGTMGVEKASSVMNESVERGLTPNQIMLEGIASGITTAATEAIPMGKWEEVAKKGFVGLHGKELAKEIASKFVANAIPEGLQEMAEDIADAIADDLIAGDKSEINVRIKELMDHGYSKDDATIMAWQEFAKQTALDGLGGFISGGVMSGGSIAVGLMNPYATGEVNREGLAGQIKNMNPEGETYKAYKELSEKRGENLENASEREVSDLFLKAYEETGKGDRTKVDEIFKNELMSHGYTEKEANTTLEASLAENPTNYQKSLIDNELVRDAMKKAYESDEATEMRLKAQMGEMALEKNLKTSEQVKAEKRIAKAEELINTAEESTLHGEKVEILGMDIKGGIYIIKTNKGSAPAEDVKVASNIKDAVAYSVNINDNIFKEAFIRNYKGQDIDAYEAYAYEAYAAGKSFNASILDEGRFGEFLGDEAVEDFLDAGRISVTRSTRESEERTIQAAANAEGKFTKGTFTSDIDYNQLKSTQKKVFNFLKGMSNIGGLNIHVIYNTETVENGYFQYDAESGGTITVNLAAKPRVDGKSYGSTYVIPVLSHELTHYLEKNAEIAYQYLQKAVFKVLRAEGMDIDEEVQSKIEKYKKHGKELSEADAIHEIIAQACEGMMSNQKTMEKTLSYMKEREMKIIKKQLDRFFNAVKNFVKSLAGGDEIQNKYALAIYNNIDEVQDAWAKAFASALERQQTLNKSVGLNEEMTADNGTTVVGEDYAQFNIQTYEKSLPFLKDWLHKSGLSQKEQNKILKELEDKRNMLEEIRKEFPHFDEWSMRDSQEEAIASFGDMTEEEEKRMRETVSKYLTAIVNNSEYPYNFDLTTVCKKRQTLNKVLNMLVEDGMFDDFIPDEKTMTEMVDLIKAHGFEVACALCFVNSKRYRVGSWADSIVNGADAYNQKKKVWVHSYGWNELVKSMEVKGKVSVNDFNFLNRDIDNDRPYRLASNMTVKELREAGALKLIDKIMETESGNTRNRKFAKAILENPSLAHTANVAELLSSEGLDIARIKAPDFHQVVNGASGQATPKLSHDAITYQNDILRKLVEKNVTPEELYKVGGFRVQSFSDYVANEIFDYVQMVSELAANKFPSHAYTKEYFFVKLFGMTGMKINMSIVPKALANDIQKKFKGWSDDKKKKSAEYQYYKAHAGLEKGTNKDGSFDWQDEDGTKWHYIIEDESFGAIRNRKENTYDPYAGFKRALEIQSDSRYSDNCGIIWVGVSDTHIRAMLRDKRIPMVIPYHKSSINHLVAEMRAIDTYNDYTDYQVEKKLNGEKLEKQEHAKLMADWDYYADLENTKDPVQTSKNYIKYCLDRGLRPVFYQFAFQEGHEGDYDYFEEGYYKVLTDFRLYGGNSDGTMNGLYAKQGPVTMSFPEEFNTLAKESLSEYESDSTYLDENQEKLYKDAKKLIEKNKKEQKQFSLKEDSILNAKTAEDITDVESAKKFLESQGYRRISNWTDKAYGKINTYWAFQYPAPDDRMVRDFTNKQFIEEAQMLNREVNPRYRTLTKGQQTYFKDSKVVDDKGHLKVMYHGTGKGGFTVFDPTKSNHGNSLFFTDSLRVATTYMHKGSSEVSRPSEINVYKPGQKEKAGVYPVFLNITNPYKVDAKGANWSNINGAIMEFGDLVNEDLEGYYWVDLSCEVDENGNIEVHSAQGDYDENLTKEQFRKEFGDELADQVEKYGIVKYDSILQNPETHDLIPNSTNSLAAWAYYHGYDGVLIDNVHDSASAGASITSNVAIVFDSNQVKSIYNENPTPDSDIRYSIQEDSEGNKLTPKQAEYFKNSKVRDEDGRLEVMYHGTTEANFTIFDSNKSDDGISFFFTNNRFVASGYSGTDEATYVDAYNLPKRIETIEDLKARFEDTYTNVREEDGDIIIEDIGDPDNVIELVREPSVKEAFENWMHNYSWDGVDGELGGMYTVYLNAENPLVIDAEGSDWDWIYPNWLSEDDFESYKRIEIVSYDKESDKIKVDWSLTGGRGGKFEVLTSEEFKEKFGNDIYKKAIEEGHHWLEDIYVDSDKKLVPSNTRDLAQYAYDNGYDSVIIENIVDTGPYSGFEDESKVVVVFNSNQIKATNNESPTKDPDIRFSLQEESEIPDDEKATYQTLEDDVNLLRDFTKLSKEDMKWQDKDMNALSDYLIKKYDSQINKEELMSDLADLYNAIPEQSDDWLKVMDACYKLASGIYEVSNSKIKVDADVDKEAQTAVAAAKRRNAIQQIAMDIYNKYWTMASYYSNTEKAKALKAKHRQNMKSALEKQKAKDKEYYSKVIEKVKKKAAEDKAKVREKTLASLDKQKEANVKKAEVEKITDQVKTLSKWIYQNSKEHPVPEPLKDPLAHLLVAIDPSSNQLLKTGKPTKKDETVSLWLHRVANVLNEINDGMASTDDADEANVESSLGMLDLPPYMVDELDKIATKMQDIESEYDMVGSKVLNQMSLEDLQKLNDDIKALKNAINTINEAISTQNKVKVNYVGQAIIQYLKKLPQAQRDALNDKLTRGIDFLTLDNTTPFYYFKHMGEGGRILFDILADGMDNMTELIEDISEFTGGVENEKTHKKEGGLYTEKEQKEWRNNTREFEVLQKLTDTEKREGIKEKKVSIKLTDAQIMSLYCLSKREINGRRQAMEHILRDGIAIGKIDGKKKVARQDTVTITEKQLNEIISIVENNPRMKAVADGLQHYMSSVCSDWGNKVTMARWGIKQFTEKYYFPIQVNGETTKTDPGDGLGSLFSLLNKNFTKPLQDNVRKEIMVYDIFDVFTQHTSDMARYSALGLPILDAIKIWNYSEAENKGDIEEERKAKEKGEKYYQQRKVDSVKKSIAKAFGEKGGNRYMSTLIKNLNGKADKGVYDNIGMGMMKRNKSAKVAASLVTAMVQPLSYIRAGYVMDSKYLAAALLHSPKVKKCFSEVDVAKWKSMSISVDTNIGRGVDRIINNQNTISDKILDKSLWLAEKMDELTWGYIYGAIELETKDRYKNLDPDSDEFRDIVNKRAREVFYSTQIFDSTLTRSAFMRDKGYHAVMLSAFMSEPTLSWNMLLDAATEYWQDAKINGSSHAFKNKGKVVASAISVYVLSAAVESALREALTRLRDYDDDDDEFFDGFIKDFIDRLIDELNPLNKLPYCKQIMDGLSAFKSAYRNNNKMDEAFISDVANAYKSIMKATERGEISYKTVWTTFNALSSLTGLPFANAIRECKAIWNNTVGRVTGNYFK